MLNKFIQVIAIIACLFQAQLAVGQTIIRPSDIVPDKQPNDIPYGTPISLSDAAKAIKAAHDEAKRRDWKMNIAVVDPSGLLLAFERMDGAPTSAISISEHKARVATKFRRDTIAFENTIINGNLAILTLDDIITVRGGNLIMSDGKIVGAIGCSGGTGSQDELICKAGVAAVTSV